MKPSLQLTLVVVIAILNFNQQVTAKPEPGTQSRSAASRAIQKSSSSSSSSSSSVSTTSTTVTTSQWHSYYVTEFAGWKSAEDTSVELEQKVKTSFSESINGYTYWDKIAKNKQYLNYIAQATGYTESYEDSLKLKAHCEKIAVSNPRLLALAYKGISRNLNGANSKLTVSKLAVSKYGIKNSEVKVKENWKSYVISNFYNLRSAEGNSKEIATKVSKCLSYDTEYFDKLIQKKVYAQYLAYATGYSGDITRYSQLKSHLQVVSKQKPRLLALGLKYLSKNLKNPKEALVIAPLAKTKYAIKEKTVHKVDWKQHLIDEYINYKSTESYKEADQRLRVSSMLNYEADSGTILDLILKRKEYRDFFAQSIGYQYSQSSYNEQQFKQYITTVSQSNPTLVSLSFRSICKNLKNKNEKLIVASSAERIIREKLSTRSSSTSRSRTENRSSSKSVTTSSKSTSTVYYSYLERYFRGVKESLESDEVVKVNENFRIAQNGAALEQLLKNQDYYSYLVKATRYSGQDNVSEFRNYLQNEYFSKRPKVIALLLKEVYQHMSDSSTTLEIPSYCKTYLDREQKVTKSSYSSSAAKSISKRSSSSSSSVSTNYQTYLKRYFSEITETSRNSEEIKRINENFRVAENGAALDALLVNKEYYSYLTKVTRYSGQDNVSEFKNYLQNEYFNKRPRFIALALRQISLYSDKSATLEIPAYCKSYFERNESASQKAISSRRVSKQTSTKRTTTTTTVSRRTTEYIKKFADLNSESDERSQIATSVSELSSNAQFEEILRDSSYAQYLATTLQYNGDCNSEAFKQYVRQTAIRERPLAVALSLKKIYQHAQVKRKLVIPAYVQRKYQLSSSSYAVSKSSSSSSASQSSSSASQSSSSASQSSSSVNKSSGSSLSKSGDSSSEESSEK